MSAKQIFEKLYPLHLNNVESLKSAIAEADNEQFFIKVLNPSHLQAHEFLFSIGIVTYLLEFSVSHQREHATYKTYKIIRNPGSFGSFEQKHLLELDITYNGSSNAPFGFIKNQIYIDKNSDGYSSKESITHIFNFGKDYLTILMQHEEKQDSTSTVEN